MLLLLVLVWRRTRKRASQLGAVRIESSDENPKSLIAPITSKSKENTEDTKRSPPSINFFRRCRVFKDKHTHYFQSESSPPLLARLVASQRPPFSQIRYFATFASPLLIRSNQNGNMKITSLIFLLSACVSSGFIPRAFLAERATIFTLRSRSSVDYCNELDYKTQIEEMSRLLAESKENLACIKELAENIKDLESQVGANRLIWSLYLCTYQS